MIETWKDEYEETDEDGRGRRISNATKSPAVTFHTVVFVLTANPEVSRNARDYLLPTSPKDCSRVRPCPPPDPGNLGFKVSQVTRTTQIRLNISLGKLSVPFSPYLWTCQVPTCHTRHSLVWKPCQQLRLSHYSGIGSSEVRKPVGSESRIQISKEATRSWIQWLTQCETTKRSPSEKWLTRSQSRVPENSPWNYWSQAPSRAPRTRPDTKMGLLV